MKGAAAIANGAWLAASLPEYRRFRRASADVETTQRSLLRNCLAQNADTVFGREHGFPGIRSWEEFAERVPVRAYDDFRPWIDRIADGEQAVLTAERVRLFEPSSGSSGAAKWIPYTAGLQAEYRRAVAVWVAALFLSRPQLMAGRAYWSLTPPADSVQAAESKVPVGFDEDSAYLGGVAQRLINYAMATPPAAGHGTDSESFWRNTAASLSTCRDLRIISAWHPSFVLLLRDKVREYLGTGDNPWPRLGLISCWGDAQAAALLPELQAAFPGVTIQPKGLLATEGVVTFPLGKQKPLALRSHFFEFEDSQGVVRPAWDLREGDQYQVIMTTGGGLYRYALRDGVVVNGCYGDTPCLEFVGKADHVVDYRGEKLSEDFVASCMNEVFDELGIEAGFAMLAPDLTAEPLGYTLYIESAHAPPDALHRKLEEKLRRGYHYALCVRLGQLRPLRVMRVRAPAFDAYSQALVARGMRLGDVKPTPLSRYTDWSERFDAFS
jgi:hypothetical protein